MLIYNRPYIILVATGDRAYVNLHPCENNISCNILNGERPLLNGANIRQDDALNHLFNTDPTDYIPLGLKENCFFVIKNGDKLERRASGRNSNFPDDCGAWRLGSPSSKTYLWASKVINAKSSFTVVVKRENLYCTRKMVNKKTLFIPISPQPGPESIVTLHRIYNKLKRDTNYRRRITWATTVDTVDLPDVALVEYTGSYPGNGPHSNCLTDDCPPYERTRPTVLDAIAKQPLNIKPDQVMTQMTKDNDELARPRDTRQIVNKRQYEKKKVTATTTTHHSKNVADHFQNL